MRHTKKEKTAKVYFFVSIKKKNWNNPQIHPVLVDDKLKKKKANHSFP
jgi:hypothetical protein